MNKKILGTKRIDPDTGKKFYDLNRDPIISPYTNISYPRSYFSNKEDEKELKNNINCNDLLSAKVTNDINNDITENIKDINDKKS